MKLRAVIPRDELLQFAAEWLPLKVLLGDSTNSERYLLLTDAKAIELLPRAGLRVVCGAQIRWPVLGLSVPITVHQLTGLISPRIEHRDGHPALVFRLTIEQADLSGVPARFDATITEAVNRALSERIKPGWQFGRMLTRAIPMPASLATTASLDLKAHAGTVEVSEEGLSFELTLDAGTTRR